MVSCTFEQFDRLESDKKVRLEKEDLQDFNELKNQLLNDLVEIRNISKELTSADTSFLSTSSHYLFQINKNVYQPMIKKIEDKEFFIDEINTSFDGVLIFRLKETIDNTTLPHFMYSHNLIWNAKYNFSPPYSGTKDVLLDSIIDENWRYIYNRVQTGH